MRKRYDYQHKCCVQCGMLMPPDVFKYHTLSECFPVMMRELETKDQIEKFKERRTNGEMPSL